MDNKKAGNGKLVLLFGGLIGCLVALGLFSWFVLLPLGDRLRVTSAAWQLAREENQRVTAIQERLGDWGRYQFQINVPVHLKDGHPTELRCLATYDFDAKSRLGENYVRVAGDPEIRIRKAVEDAVKEWTPLLHSSVGSPVFDYIGLSAAVNLASMSSELPVDCQEPVLQSLQVFECESKSVPERNSNDN